MTRYVVSDHHFNHNNIIEYSERPYQDAEMMNSDMIDKWNRIVSEDDSVIYGGDLVFGSVDDFNNILDKLNGNIMVIKGNHDDDFSADNLSYPIVEDTIIQYHGYRFWYTHRPENVPDDWSQWILHGHVHNNEPFIDYSKNKINVCVEVVGYMPIPLNIIVKALDNLNNDDVCQTVMKSPIKDFEWFTENTT